MKRIKLYVRSFGVLALSAMTLQTEAALDSFTAAQCPIGKPLAQWDFNNGDLPSENNTHVNWWGDHNGIQNIPGTDYKGIKFNYRGKAPDKDSSSEWRYGINTPLSRTWEYLRFYQPKNFYHRYIVRIDAPENLNQANWNIDDVIVNSRGMEARVAGVENAYLYIKQFNDRFDHNWGNGKVIENKDTGAVFTSKESRSMVTNNKLSAQWQGKYSNAGMIMETEALVPNKGGEFGVSYLRPTINTSKAHKNRGDIKNSLAKVSGSAFHPEENGTVVELLIERIRSSGENIHDASYRVWKRTETTTWTLGFENTNLYAWQPDNYFDKGYVMGWANSGYRNDTDFYLLGWALWAEIPPFLPKS